MLILVLIISQELDKRLFIQFGNICKSNLLIEKIFQQIAVKKFIILNVIDKIRKLFRKYLL